MTPANQRERGQDVVRFIVIVVVIVNDNQFACDIGNLFSFVPSSSTATNSIFAFRSYLVRHHRHSSNISPVAAAPTMASIMEAGFNATATPFAKLDPIPTSISTGALASLLDNLSFFNVLFTLLAAAVLYDQRRFCHSPPSFPLVLPPGTPADISWTSLILAE